MPLSDHDNSGDKTKSYFKNMKVVVYISRLKVNNFEKLVSFDFSVLFTVRLTSEPQDSLDECCAEDF